MLNYALQVDKKSMFNTPNTFGIFALNACLTGSKPGRPPQEMAKLNELKAAKLYAELDVSPFWQPKVDVSFRSSMNVTWGIDDETLESTFVQMAQDEGLVGLKGHRSVGGLRASIYNACPIANIDIDRLHETLRKALRLKHAIRKLGYGLDKTRQVPHF